MGNRKAPAATHAVDFEHADFATARGLDAPVEVIIAIVNEVRRAVDFERLVARVGLPRELLNASARAETLVALGDFEIEIRRGTPRFAARRGTRRIRVAAEEEMVAVGALLKALGGGVLGGRGIQAG